MTTIVVSAVNLRKGGTLTILRQCLEYLSGLASMGEYRVVTLVHKRVLADYPHIEYIELPWAADGWLKRMWCEYYTMGKVSREIGDIDLWLSLHDTTPRVQARRQAVYCQTSFPFLKWRWSDFRFDPKIPLFAMLTRFAYQIGIKRNRYLVVQQEWLRQGFSKMFGIPKESFVLTPPNLSASIPVYTTLERSIYTFFFASTPDCHKDFETLCAATEQVEQAVGKGRFRTVLTVRGDENRYARYLYDKWGSVASIEFAGLMDKPTLYAHYALADCFVFPSRIETWGLPISEYMQIHDGQGAMLLADLTYAYETSAGSQRTAFFPSGDATHLARMMRQLVEGDDSALQPIPKLDLDPPLARDWASLFALLIDKDLGTTVLPE